MAIVEEDSSYGTGEECGEGNKKKSDWLPHFARLQAIWNWLDTYPEEFTDLQKRPNSELSGKNRPPSAPTISRRSV